MTDYRTIMTMILMGYTQRDIAAACKASPKTIVAARKAVEQGKLTAADIACLTDREIRDIVSPPRARSRNTRAEPDFDWTDQELAQGKTVKAVWKSYQDACISDGLEAYSYNDFAALLRKRNNANRATAFPRLEPGALLLCAMLPCGLYVGEDKYKCCVFMLPYSQEIKILPTQNIKKDWPKLMVKCLIGLGGAPALLHVPEDFSGVYRTKKGVTQVRQTSEDLLKYYGIVLAECLPEPLEAELRVVSGRLQTSLAGQSFPNLTELEARIDEIRGLFSSEALPSGKSRKELFEVYERSGLRPLPEKPFEETIQKEAKILYNYHVSFEKVFYSVPPEAYKDGRDVVLLITRKKIEIVSHQGEVLAVHARRSPQTTTYSTLREHVRSEEYLTENRFEWTAARFIAWAGRSFSPSAAAIVKHIIDSRAISTQAYRTCMSFLQMGEAEEEAGRLDQFLLVCDACKDMPDPIKGIRTRLRT